MTNEKKLGDVELTVHDKTKTKTFGFSHAERILKMDNNGGWKLPEKSPYKFTKKNGLKSKQSSGAN